MTHRPPSDFALSRRDLTWGVFVFLAAIAVFLPTLGYDFVNWDDETYVTKNPWLWDLTWERLLLPFRASINGAWTPLPMVGYLFEYQVFGLEPFGYRAINFLFHGLAMAGAFVLLRLLGAVRVVAALVSAFVAIHPLRIESVVWISQFKDVLCTAFFVWALIAWHLAGRVERKERVCFGVAGALYVLALLSKPMAVSFPLVVVLHDVFFARGQMKKRLWFYGVLLLPAIAVSIGNLLVQDLSPNAELSLFEKLKIALYGPLHYAVLTIWPWELSPLYPREFRPTTNGLAALAGTVFSVALLGAGIFAAVRGKRAVAFGIFAAAVAFSPVSGIVSFSYFFAADRFTYLPGILLAAAVAVPLSRWTDSNPARARIVAGVFGVALIYSAAATLMLSPVWKNSQSLFGRMVEQYPLHAPSRDYLRVAGGSNEGLPPLSEETDPEDLHYSRALGAIAAADYEEAETHLQEMADRRLALRHLIVVRAQRGDMEAAVQSAREILALDPPAGQALQGLAARALAEAGEQSEARAVLDALKQPSEGAARAWSALAYAALRKGDSGQALADARQSLRLMPFHAEAFALVASLGVRGRETEAAVMQLEKAETHPAISPADRTKAQAWLAALARVQNNMNEAERWTELAFDPDGISERPVDELLTGAPLAQQTGRRDLAIRMYRAVLEKDPRNLPALRALPPMLVVAGQPEEALELLRLGTELFPDDAKITELHERLEAEMEAAGRL